MGIILEIESEENSNKKCRRFMINLSKLKCYKISRIFKMKAPAAYPVRKDRCYLSPRMSRLP